MFLIYFAVSLQFFYAFCGGEVAEDIYKFTAKDVKGNHVNLSDFRGKVLLIVNVASECGYTDNHYREMVQLQAAFKDRPFAILAFPCNQFGAQEPKRNSAIERFARHHYNINFPLFSKIQVIGQNAHPLYQWLRNMVGEEPNWNFCKYLVSKEGKVVKFEYSNISPMAMFNDIEQFFSPTDQPVKQEL